MLVTRWRQAAHRTGQEWVWLLLGLGGLGAVVALSVAPHQARQAASQTWTPFVLVSGLLMVGLVAAEEGLFRAAGLQLARRARNGTAFFACAALLIAVVTATLNLDTSVVFVTPVLIAAARSRGAGEPPLLYGSLLLANASSLFLPGSNLTNLIVLGHQAPSGGAFLARLWPAATAACVVTACGVGWWGRRQLRSPRQPGVQGSRFSIGLGSLGVGVTTVLVLILHSPAVPVLMVGVVVSAVRLGQRKLTLHRLTEIVGLPVLAGLFGATVALGTLARLWNGPASLLSHLGTAGVAVAAAVTSVLINNLPAAALLAPGHAPHAAALLIGLNLGPNLFVTGSLAWILWLRMARVSGAEPSVRQASRLGLVIVPLSMAAALAALWLI